MSQLLGAFCEAQRLTVDILIIICPTLITKVRTKDIIST